MLYELLGSVAHRQIAAAGESPAPKSARSSVHVRDAVVANPLVVLVGIKDYDARHLGTLHGVARGMDMMRTLFEYQYNWEVPVSMDRSVPTSRPSRACLCAPDMRAPAVRR